MINSIHTSCKECIFADYDGNTQKGCHLDYINRYKEKNVQVLDVFDDSKEFFVINDRKCIGHKSQNWFDTIGMRDSSLDEKINKINELNKLSYLLVIDLKKISNDELNNIFNHLNHSTIKPQKIVFIKYPGFFSFEEIDVCLKRIEFEVIWTVQDMLDTSLSHEQIIHNIINMHKEYNFLCVIKKYNLNIVEFIEKVNNLIFNELELFSLAKNFDQTCYLFNTLVYRNALFIENVDILNDSTNHIII